MYNNSTDRIIHISNSTKSTKYKILTFPTHERYESQLCKTGHEFYAFNHSNLKKWNEKQTEVPSNYHILPEDQLCQYLNYDFILVQSKFGQFQLAQRLNQILNIPIICLEHTIPTPQTMNTETINEMKQMQGHINVFISNFSMKQWNIPGVVIHHGIDTSTFSNTNQQKEDYVLTVANDFVNRDYCLNYSGWKRVTKELHTKLVGDTKGLSQAADSVEDLVDQYNKCLLYFNSTTLSPIPMSLLEAMSCECAVVSTATCMIPEIIENSKNGFISNDEEELRLYINNLIKNPDLRSEIGINARQTIQNKFSETVFIDNWNNLFNQTYEASII
jgi:glycosyltransferase involved in cell wall biosynthesis